MRVTENIDNVVVGIHCSRWGISLKWCHYATLVLLLQSEIYTCLRWHIYGLDRAI